jgi:putative transposase
MKISGGCYFFTVNLMDRKAKTLTDNIDLLRTAYANMRRKHPFHCDAIVILPDHLHTVWTLPAGDCDYSKRLQLFKAGFSRYLPSAPSRSASVVGFSPRVSTIPTKHTKHISTHKTILAFEIILATRGLKPTLPAKILPRRRSFGGGVSSVLGM